MVRRLSFLALHAPFVDPLDDAQQVGMVAPAAVVVVVARRLVERLVRLVCFVGEVVGQFAGSLAEHLAA